MYLFPGSRPKKGLSSNGFTKTVTSDGAPHELFIWETWTAGASTRVTLFLWAFSRKGATGVPLFTTWVSVAGLGRAPIPGNISGRSRPRKILSVLVAQLVGRLGSDGFWKTRITGGGSGYAAHLAHAGGALYGTELGSVTLKRIGFFCFPIKHSTHTVRLRSIVPKRPTAHGLLRFSLSSLASF